jgi:hypothetical protein
MKRSIHLAIPGVALAVAASVAMAQTPQTPPAKPAAALPSANQVLDKYVQAVGGKAALEKLTSRVSKGTFEAPDQGAGGTVTLYAKAPNKAASVVIVANFGEIRQGFDGTVGWAQGIDGGVREMNGQELSVARRAADFRQALKLRELYPKMTVKGTEKAGSHDVYVIEADPRDGSLRRMYFDVESGLLLHNEIERDTQIGRATFTTDLEDYREVDGIKVPFTVRQTNPNVSLVIKITEVKHNVPIDDAQFAKPAAP